jgi:hypothetical protein
MRRRGALAADRHALRGAYVITNSCQRDRTWSSIAGGPSGGTARRCCRSLVHFAAALLAFSSIADGSGARAETLVVVEARGIASTAGAVMDSTSHLRLRRGEHVRLIGENGNQYCVDGPYEGPARPVGGAPTGTGRSLWSLLQPDGHDQADPLTDCIR